MSSVLSLFRQSSQIHALAPASWHQNRSLNWQQMLASISAVAACLKAQGVKPGDRVALLAHNSDRFLVGYCAVLWAGGIVVPLNTRLTSFELLPQLQDAEPIAVLAGTLFSDLLQEIEQLMPDMTFCLWLDSSEVRLDLSWRQLTIHEALDYSPMENEGGKGRAVAAALFYRWHHRARQRGDVQSRKSGGQCHAVPCTTGLSAG